MDLGQSRLFDLAFLVKAQISGSYKLINGLSNVHEAGFSYLPAEDVKAVDAGIDSSVSVESFQEIDI